jgi:hypothetical protein
MGEASLERGLVADPDRQRPHLEPQHELCQ